MNPDQESTPVNDPFEFGRSRQQQSHYAQDEQSSSPVEGADKTIDTTTYIITIPSSMSMAGRQGRQLSNEPTEESKNSKNLAVASTLVVTYLIEVTVQILLIVQCCRSLEVGLFTTPDASPSSSAKNSWSWLLVISSVLSSFLVTLISIIWVFRGMDFSGRLCGRLLCYVMHSLLLGLPWRYLKLAFAYDKADLEEFLRLKTIQTYLQSLPLVTIHLAWVMTMTQQPTSQYPVDSYHALSSWLVVVEMLTAVTSLLVLSTMNSQSVYNRHNINLCGCPEIKGEHPNHHLHFDDSVPSARHHQDHEGGSKGLLNCFTTMLAHYSRNGEPGRALLLVARVISLGMLVKEMTYWAGFLSVVHLTLCFVWFVIWGTLLQQQQQSCRKSSFLGQSSINDNNCCDTCSNDSGVVKSDINASSHYPDVQMTRSSIVEDEEEGESAHAGVDYVNNDAAGEQQCASNNHPRKKGNCSVRQVITQLLPLAYALFWDLSCCSAMKLNLWAATLPVLLATLENVSITMFEWYRAENLILIVVTTTCLLVGWLSVATFECQRHRELRKAKDECRQDTQQNIRAPGNNPANDEPFVRNASSREKSANKKETGECLSLCCSSLSHPLNIKRKGHHNHPPPTCEQQQRFCNDKMTLGSVGDTPVTVKYNEYEEQQDLGKLMNCQMNHANPHHNSKDQTSHRSGRGLVNHPIPSFPDLGLSDHTGVNRGGGGNGDGAGERPKSVFAARYNRQDDATACARNTPSKAVTNNYANIKEALTRRISNKSCASLKKPSHRFNQDGDMKGEDCRGDALHTTSLKSSSPSSRLPAPTNSQKCIPISIKPPISWFPETCCNDSSGSGDSSNSRNTNTLAESRFYCPENYADLDNNNEIERKERTATAPTSASRVSPKEETRDFSIVFFDGRGTTRSHKQKQARTTAARVDAPLRTARSANATPVAKYPFPFDVPTQSRRGESGVRQVAYHPYSPYHHHHHFHQHQFSYDSDPIEKASKGTRRNQITGKTYLSDGGSLTSLDALCEIRASTPVEIKKASRVIVNCPPPHHQVSDSKTVSRCLCTKVDSRSSKCPVPVEVSKCHNDDDDEDEQELVTSGGAGNNIYEKLIDDSYGILICEGENTPRQSGSGGGGTGGSGEGAARRKIKTTGGINGVVASSQPELSSSHHSRARGTAAGVHVPSQKLRILCAKCLENHDPLLTNCVTLGEQDHHYHHDEIDHYHPNDPVSASSPSRRNHHPLQARHVMSSLPQLVSDSPLHTPGSDSTDYPSDTEFTTNNGVIEDDGQSLSTHFSSTTYTWHNAHYQPTQLSQFIWAAASMMPPSRGECGGDDGENSCPKEFTSLEYVRTWLMASHPRTYPVTQQPHHHPQQQQHVPSNDTAGSNVVSKSSKTLTPRNTTSHNRHHHHRHSGMKAGGGSATADKGLSSSAHNISVKSKSTCDKAISKKKRQLRQLEKRQRPIGRGASPPAKEQLCSNNSVPLSGPPDPLLTKSTTTAAPCNNNGSVTRLKPPPSRKQHPLLVYDMIPHREEQEKPLTATTHKKCRDQLDLFHKELETVV